MLTNILNASLLAVHKNYSLYHIQSFRAGAPLNEPRPELFYGGGAEGYTDYPFM